MIPKRASAAVVVALALVVVACGGDDDDSSAGTGAADTSAGTGEDTAAPGTGGDTTSGGTEPTGTDSSDGGNCDATVPGTQIDYGTYAPASSLDPTLSSGALVGGAELAAIYDVLIRYDYETNEYIPQLAESITPNDDYTVWTLKLREGITYSDGTPLTAQLVSDNMDRYFAEGVRNTSGGFMTPIESKTAVDDLTLEITLNTPWAELPYVFADEPGMIVNLNVVGDDAEAFGANPPEAGGIGPYVLERFAPGEEMVFKARDDYWGGPVCIETLRVVTIPGAQATFDAFNNDELNVAFLRDPVVNAQAKDAGLSALWAQQDGASNIYINHRAGRPGEDPRVREAVMLAADLDILNERAYQGALTAGKSLVQEGSRFHSDAIAEAPTDMDRAKQLVEEAKADGFDGNIELLCQNTPPTPDVALAVEGMLTEAGFTVTNNSMPITDVIGEMVQGNYDLVCSGLGAGPDTGPTAMMRALRSDSPSNRMGYASEEMDAAIDGLLAAATPEAQQAAVASLNDQLVSDSVYLPIGAHDEGAVWKDDVQGITATVSTILLFDDAYIAD